MKYKMLVLLSALPFLVCLSIPIVASTGDPLRCCACRAIAVATNNPTIALCR